MISFYKFNIFYSLDRILMNTAQRKSLKGSKRFCMEFLYFGIKQARACLFAGLFFIAIFCVPHEGLFGFYRYDLLLIIALLIQVFMVFSKLESTDELKAICLFHFLGFLLETFKTSVVQSWAYPDFAYSKIFGVPLFSGFMYAAVGSYIIQSWRLLDIKVRHHPPYQLAIFVSMLIYLNFFTHHYIGDFRYYIASFLLGLYARSMVHFTPLDKERKMPLLLSFAFVGFFIWLAENLGTFFGIWKYPHQLGAWAIVSVGKWGAWSLVIVMTFTITTFLKDIKAKIHIAK
ncbi:DUF817 domain-containing protein [Helicobacter didelphidarum]|uniref:DUF817 domain-containing protein n=1 Tax=Helicobacter didelphidarum TaxID=2040648 RepID=A0A3D8IK90_9HELI|nr:DUF817 domain-containing protein [Helicobacter didelphidarum]RDU64981.1 DUF817 domain-containing protein [Helicobacter didelphidarum]